MKLLNFLLLLVISISCLANDGSFYASGNHLIPIQETDIAVKKEILTLKKIRDEYIEVTVYYEFFNPKDAKEITVGFEAKSPFGDVDGTPKNGQHPYMNDFTVQLNGEMLKYNVAYVMDSVYVKNGIIKGVTLAEAKKSIYNENDVNFLYVYYFKAKFKKGLNIIKHTYSYRLSSSVMENYSFEYVLTAANRWGNKQIDDFTLLLDLGEFESFNIDKDFFNDTTEWLIHGIGKTTVAKTTEIGKNPGVRFHIQKGYLIFQKKNFHPTGELSVYSPSAYSAEPSKDILPFSYYRQQYFEEPKTEFEKKVYKNLPFARRGYIFQNPELKKFFEAQEWYIPNPNYQPDEELISEIEKKFLKSF